MLRKPRKSALEDWIGILARLPWQACLVLAVLSWFGFHQLAQIEPPKPTTVAALGAAYGPMLARTAGMLLQLIAPAACLIAALFSWIGKRRRRKLLADTETRTSSAPLMQISWREFEQLVGAYFERLGYAVTFTPDGADGGVDVIARKGRETFLIQCKQWRATQVGVSVVRELFGVMAAQGATGAYVVSIGAFSKDAHDFAQGRNIELVDAHQLLKAGPDSRHNTASKAPVAAVPAMTARECPRCGSAMVQKVAKQGSNKGQFFYGCSTYPRCRGTRPIS